MKRLALTLTLLVLALVGLGIVPAEARKNPPLMALPAPTPTGVLTFDQNNDVVSQALSDGTFLKLTNDAVFDGNPSWSPDGLKLVYASNQAGDTSLYTMNSDGSNKVRLTTPSPFTGHYHPDWGSDNRIRFYVEDYNEQGRDGLYVVDSNGSNLMPLRSGKGLYDPALSPDGLRLAYSVTNQTTGRADVVILTLSTGTVVTLTGSESETFNRFPSWDGNGSLYFQSNLNTPQIKRVDINPIAITSVNIPGPARYPSAGPDGWLAYSNGASIGVFHPATGEGNLISSPSPFTANPDWHWAPIGKTMPIKTVR